MNVLEIVFGEAEFPESVSDLLWTSNSFPHSQFCIVEQGGETIGYIRFPVPIFKHVDCGILDHINQIYYVRNNNSGTVVGFILGGSSEYVQLMDQTEQLASLVIRAAELEEMYIETEDKEFVINKMLCYTDIKVHK